MESLCARIAMVAKVTSSGRWSIYEILPLRSCRLRKLRGWAAVAPTLAQRCSPMSSILRAFTTMVPQFAFSQ